RRDDGAGRALADRLAAPAAPGGGGGERMNDLSFVMHVVDLLEDARLRVWLFGGWAEELRGLRAPCEHVDVDFLYPGRDLARAAGRAHARASRTSRGRCAAASASTARSSSRARTCRRPAGPARS